jgi:hypothetical protein
VCHTAKSLHNGEHTCAGEVPYQDAWVAAVLVEAARKEIGCRRVERQRIALPRRLQGKHRQHMLPVSAQQRVPAEKWARRMFPPARIQFVY